MKILIEGEKYDIEEVKIFLMTPNFIIKRVKRLLLFLLDIITLTKREN